MQGGAEARLEELHWLDEGYGVGAEVCEEEGQCVEYNEEPLADGHDVRVTSSQDNKEDSHHCKTLHQ